MTQHARVAAATQALPPDLAELLEQARYHKRKAQRHRRKARELMEQLAAAGIDLRDPSPDTAPKEA